MFYENPITTLIALPTKRLNSMPNGHKNGPNLKIVFAALEHLDNSLKSYGLIIYLRTSNPVSVLCSIG